MLLRHEATGARPGRRRGREPRVRRPVVLRITQNPSRKGGFRCFARFSSSPLRGSGSDPRGRRRIRRCRRPGCVPGHRRRLQRQGDRHEAADRIVSLSPTATETLFAIGAGPQVVAVDDQSDFPKSAPKTRSRASRRTSRRSPTTGPTSSSSRTTRRGSSDALGRARHRRRSTRTVRRASRAPTSRSASSGRSPVGTPGRPGSSRA